MKNFRILHLCKGFALMEVAIAIAIVGILLTPILILQYNVFRRVAAYKQQVEHMLPLKQVFFSASLLRSSWAQGASAGSAGSVSSSADVSEYKELIEEPLMTVTYKKNSVKEGQFARFKGVSVDRVTGVWQDWYGQKEESMMVLSFGLIANEQSEEKERALLRQGFEERAPKGVS